MPSISRRETGAASLAASAGVRLDAPGAEVSRGSRWRRPSPARRSISRARTSTAYAPGGGAPVLFLSQAEPLRAPGLPIRGGIPLAFPWFGRKAGEPAAPLHGLARLVPWRLEAATVDAAGVVELTFALAERVGPGVA